MTTPIGDSAPIIGRPINRKLLWLDGRWFLTWIKDSAVDYMVYAQTESETCDHTTFSSPASLSLGAITAINNVSWCTDGSAIHVAFLDGTTVKYCRFSNSGGTLTPGTIRTVTTGASAVNGVCMTSDKHVVISFTASSHCKVCKNSYESSSDSWSNDTDIDATGVKQVSSATTVSYTNVVPLTGGGFLVGWTTNTSAPIMAREWDGSAWGSIETAGDTNVTDAYGWSMASFNDDVWIGWTSFSTYYYIRARKRNAAGTWESSSPYKLNLWGGSGSGGDNIAPSISINQSSGDVYYWWKHTSNKHGYYMRFDYAKAAWDSAVDLGDLGTAVDYMYGNAAFAEGGNYVAFCHGIGSGGTYYVNTVTVFSPGGAAAGPSGGCMIFGGMGIL